MSAQDAISRLQQTGFDDAIGWLQQTGAAATGFDRLLDASGESLLDASAGREDAAPAPGTTRLRDRTIGYYVTSEDNCWSAAVATVLQVPIHELPDLRIDERVRAGEAEADVNRSSWREMRRWLADEGLRMVTHREVPVDAERWVGVVPVSGWFQSHCLVMARDEILFDPVPDALRRDKAALSGQALVNTTATDQRLAALPASACELPGWSSLGRGLVWRWRPSDVAFGFSFQERTKP